MPPLRDSSDALADLAEALGRRGRLLSSRGYAAWAADGNRTSLSTIIRLYGTWRKAVAAAKFALAGAEEAAARRCHGSARSASPARCCGGTPQPENALTDDHSPPGGERPPDDPPETGSSYTVVSLFGEEAATKEARRRSDAAAREEAVQRVFAAWVESVGGSSRRVLSEVRRKRIHDALFTHGYPEDDVLAAVRGWRYSSYHAGQNRDRRVYNDLELLLRSPEKIEFFRDAYRDGSKRAAVANATAANARDRKIGTFAETREVVL